MVYECGEEAFSFFELVIKSYVNDGVCFEIYTDINNPKSNLSQETREQIRNRLGLLESLEKQGFIVSTECTKNFIKIKPIGSYTNESCFHFCIHMGKDGTDNFDS